MKTNFFFHFLLLLFSFCSISAQTSPKTEPFQTGESLVYEGKFSKALLRGIAIADLSFVVERLLDSINYSVKTTAKSKGTLPKLLDFKFSQDIKSFVDGEKFQVLKTVKRDEQGDRVRDGEAIFDYKTKKVIYTETDPNDVARPPRRAASTIENGTQDLVTAIYMLRRLPLAVGKSFELKISDSGLVYKIPVRVAARELQKSVLGKIWCFRVEPEIFGRNRLIEREGKMILWITDDARRLPIRSQINTNIGRIEVKLKQVK
ncbi:MAG: DUF3108 domain-containing protein [Acidobacteriota bacterium]|nr:DUF3108 domain-containing protein [Acidobacteriota bacterium]